MLVTESPQWLDLVLLFVVQDDQTVLVTASPQCLLLLFVVRDDLTVLVLVTAFLECLVLCYVFSAIRLC